MANKMLVMYVEHGSPYNGCFWEKNFFLVKATGDRLTSIKTIYCATEHPDSPNHKMELADAQRLFSAWTKDAATKESVGYFDKPDFHPLDDKLYDVVPHNLYPKFANFFNVWPQGKKQAVKGYVFTWQCGQCKMMVSDLPGEMTGYRGNGGIGIEADGWTCDACQAKNEAAEAAEQKKLYDEFFPKMVEKFKQLIIDTLKVASGDPFSCTPDEDGDDAGTYSIGIDGNMVSFGVIGSEDWDGSHEGMNAHSSIVGEEGNILGEASPYNFTNRVWTMDEDDLTTRMNGVASGLISWCTQHRAELA